jgi:ribosomal protein S6
MEITEATENKDESALKVYEVGYHLLPLLAEEQLPAEVGNLKGAIESKGGLFISEEFPKLRPLAYEISKTVEGKKHHFEQAYFGWVKFEVSPESIGEINNAFKKNTHVLRHILIETVRESTMSFIKPAYKKDEDKEGEPEPKEVITKEDEEKISQSIDSLIAE